MSLRDTIEGARREAEGNVVGRPKKEAEAVVDEEHKGFSRSSAAKAKPSREAAASVRVSTKPKSNSPFGPSETKEEKRERKRREREEQDLRNRAFDYVLRNIPEYRRSEKTFWILVGTGMGFAVLSLVCMYVFGEVTDVTSVQGILSTGTLVVAYACIIGGIVYDFVKRRPFRKQAEARVSALTDKKLLEIFEHEQAVEAARQADKESRKAEKAARRGKK